MLEASADFERNMNKIRQFLHTIIRYLSIAYMKLICSKYTRSPTLVLCAIFY